METLAKHLGIGVIFIVLILVFAGIFSFFTFWAWNITMPYLFHLPTVNLYQAFALNMLAGALIKPNNYNANTKK